MSTARGHVPTVRPIGNHGLARCWKKRALADGIPPTYLHDSFAPVPRLRTALVQGPPLSGRVRGCVAFVWRWVASHSLT